MLNHIYGSVSSVREERGSRFAAFEVKKGGKRGRRKGTLPSKIEGGEKKKSHRSSLQFWTEKKV